MTIEQALSATSMVLFCFVVTIILISVTTVISTGVVWISIKIMKNLQQRSNH